MNDEYTGAHYISLSIFVCLKFALLKKVKGVYVMEACKVSDEGSEVFKACGLE